MSELQRITAEIDLVSAALEKLLHAQEAFRTVISQQTSLVAPVRRLPVELLELVFSNCLQMNVISNRSEESCSLPTLTLSHVIHHWRSIIWHMPTMWSHIALAIGSHDDPEGHHGLQRQPLLHMYLARSSPLPLDVHITPYPWHPTMESYGSLIQSDHTLLEGLALESVRWRTLTIDGGIVKELPGDIANLSVLESLEISSNVHSFPGDWFSATSSLRRIQFHDEFPGDLIAVDLTRVEKVRIRWAEMDDLLFLGFHAPLMCWLHMEMFYSEADPSHRTFERLETLEVEEMDSLPALDHLFTFTTMPALRILRLGIVRMDQTWHQSAFTMFLDRSSCQLRALSLKRFTITETEILEILPLLPALEYLVLLESPKAPGAAINSRLLDALGQFVPDAGHNQHPRLRLLPLLHSLELQGAFIGRVFDSDLPSMLDARTEGDSRHYRLRHIKVGVTVGLEIGETRKSRIKRGKRLTDAGLQRLEHMTARGVSVVVTTYGSGLNLS